MKKLMLIPVFALLPNNAYPQVKEIKMANESFLKSIEWYVAQVKRSYDSIGRPIKDDELGVVSVEFYNHYYKYGFLRGEVSDTTVKEQFLPDYLDCEYLLSITDARVFNNQTPTYYFVHKEIRVAIFTGLERMIFVTKPDQHDRKEFIRKMTRKTNWEVFNNPYIPEYIITIDEYKSKDFTARRSGNLGPPKTK